MRQRLYGIKVGVVWAIFPNDLEAFKRTRRPPGRPRTAAAVESDQAAVKHIANERKRAGTRQYLRKRGPKSS
jgi:hypothetical protein